MAADAQVGLGGNAASDQLLTQLLDQRISLETSGPNQGVRIDGCSGLEMNTGRLNLSYTLAEMHHDLPPLQRPLRVVLKLGLERRKQLGPELVDVNLCCIGDWVSMAGLELFREQFSNRPGNFHTGRAATNHDEAQCTIIHERGLGGRSLELTGDMSP